MPPTVADWLLKSAMKSRRRQAFADGGKPGGLQRARSTCAALYERGPKLWPATVRDQIISGQGPNITFISCADKMHFSVQACREQLPDIWHLSESIESAIDQLLALAEASGE